MTSKKRSGKVQLGSPLVLTRRGFIGAAGAAAAATAFSGPSFARDCDQVIVGTWGGDYSKLLDENIHQPILKPKGIEVLPDISDQNTRKAKMLAQRNARRAAIDVTCLIGADMYEMYKQDTLRDGLSPELVPNYANILPKLKRSYSIPHIYSGRVVVYNPGKVPFVPDSYEALWDPAFKDRIGFSDLLYFHFIESAAMTAGGSPTNYDPGFEKLLELKKKNNPKIYPSNEALATALKNEEVWVTIMWRARAVMWHKSGIDVTSAAPKEGVTPIAFEAAVLKNAPDMECGLAYLDAMLDPKAQIAFAKKMGYVPTVTNAKLPAEMEKELAFTPEQQEHFFIQDFDYIAKNNAKWLEWWNQKFKA